MENNQDGNQVIQGESQEPTNDQAVSQDQIKEITERIRKEVAEQFKSELAGMNRAVSKAEENEKALKKQLKEKELSAMSEAEKAKAYEAEIAERKKELEAIEAESSTLKRQRIIDNVLSSEEVSLPLDIFETRINGETEEEIKEDAAKLKGYITAEIEKGIEAEVNRRLAGKKPVLGKPNPETKKDKLDEALKSGKDGMAAAMSMLYNKEK